MFVSSSESFLQAFSAIIGAGKFHSNGHAPFFFPELEVEGVGDLAFPLPAAQARELASISEKAPFGQGEQTVHDESVRKCWQLDASRFSIKSPQWEKFLAETLAKIRDDLGIAGKISAVPYKLLLYGKGGHFKAHRDTEKLDSMFGSLIIALPSAHQGGRLLIRHDGREIEVDFSREQHRHDFQYAAFFADCEHEVEPVQSGFRCCLAYNLRLDDGDPQVLNLPLDTQAQKLVAPLNGLKKETPGELTAVLLAHNYTESGVSLRKLKGDDRARAHALFAAARETGFVAHLGLVTQYKMGELEGDDHYRRWDDDENDPVNGDMGEIYEESLTIDHWRNAKDKAVRLGKYNIDKERLLADENDDFGSGDPDREEAEGFTGNAGCTIEYWYHGAAIVLWAQEDEAEILCKYNFQGACEKLTTLAAKKSTTLEFQRLARAIIARSTGKLSQAGHFRRGDPADTHPLVLTLNALVETEALELLEELLTDIPDEAWDICNAKTWKKLLKTFGIEPFSKLFRRLLTAEAEKSRQILFPVLEALLARKMDEVLTRKIAVRLARLVPGSAKTPSWQQNRTAPLGNPAEVRIMLAASQLIDDPDERLTALNFVLAHRSLDTIREVLAPVLIGKPALTHTAGIGTEVLDFAKNLLKKEIARPLMPFPDWIRPCPEPSTTTTRSQWGAHITNLQKRAAAMQELVTFMANPAAETHGFRYPQDVRDALSDFISTQGLDLQQTTIRKGSPHTLACTKTDQSYHKSLSTRTKDEELLKKLEAIP